MAHPIVERELLGTLRTGRALVLLLFVPIVLALLVVSRWPGNATVELSGAQAQEVFRLFAYSLLAVMILLVPAFPATSIVQERKQGTLTLLLNSPLSAFSIVYGKVVAMVALIALFMGMSLPAATAAYAMGGISLETQILPLYGVLLLVLLQYTTLGLLVSTWANSVDAAVRITYAIVLLLAVGSLGPHFFLQGKPGMAPLLAANLRCVSPIPVLMELAGHGDVGTFGLSSVTGPVSRFIFFAIASTAAFAVATVWRLNSFILDRPRSAGMIVDDQSLSLQRIRRLLFLVDPKRRTKGIGFLLNPVMVKEFRTRRFGRIHWLLRLVSLAALFSLWLTYAATNGTIDWGVETIGGIMVVLQVALVVVITPSLAANLISAERESGGWTLLMMTPMSVASVLFGKLASVALTLVLLLFATLPGYLVMIWIRPALRWQVWQVMICLGWMTCFAIMASMAISSLCRRTAVATAVAYAVLGSVCIGTLIFWLGRDTTFDHGTVEAILKINPMAAALTVIEAPGFTRFNLTPENWSWMAGFCAISAAILVIQTWRLTRPQ